MNTNNKKNVLIVEDELIIALDIENKLKAYQNFNFEIASSGEKAVKRVKQRDFSLVLMDIKLEGTMDGIEAARIIKKEYDIPIIFVSGNTDLLHSDRLKDTKPSGILKKPVVDGELFEMIDEIFELRNN